MTAQISSKMSINEIELLHVNMMITVSARMKAKLQKLADSKGTSLMAIVRQAVCEKYQIVNDIDAKATTRKYASPEARKAAYAAANREKRALAKELLTKYAKGEIK